MSDELDSLSDAQLSEVFAVEVAGYSEPKSFWSEFLLREKHTAIIGGHRDEYPQFATSSDAVLPWLEKAHGIRIWLSPLNCRQWLFEIILECGSGEISRSAPTFARAACIALILARRQLSPSVASTALTASSPNLPK